MRILLLLSLLLRLFLFLSLLCYFLIITIFTVLKQFPIGPFPDGQFLEWTISRTDSSLNDIFRNTKLADTK